MFSLNPRINLLSCLVLPCLALPRLALPCLVLSCLVLSCLVLSCLVLSCLVLSCLVLSCLVLSCLVVKQYSLTPTYFKHVVGWSLELQLQCLRTHENTWHFQVDRDLSEYDEQSSTSIDVSYFTSALIYCLIYTSALTHLSFNSTLKQELLMMLILDPLSPTIVVFNPCYYPIKNTCCKRNVCLNIKIWKWLVSSQTNLSNFHPLEVVDRGSETQPHVGDKVF